MKIAFCMIALLLVSGCGSDSANEDTIGTEIADDYNRAMDDAAAVEEQLLEHQREIEEAIEVPE